jgi:hypothetical protein
MSSAVSVELTTSANSGNSQHEDISHTYKSIDGPSAISIADSLALTVSLNEQESHSREKSASIAFLSDGTHDHIARNKLACSPSGDISHEQ